MPLSGEGSSRTFRQNVTLAVLLASVAGAVNAVGFFVLGTHTSHMSGHVAELGEALGTGEFALAKTAVGWVLAFVGGAATASVMVELGRRRLRRGRYVAPLALEAVILVWVAAVAVKGSLSQRDALAALLAFAMGMQNALVTRISNAVIRTTHLTGVLTDIGIGLVSLISWFRLHREVLGEEGGFFASLRRAEPLRNLWLHFALLSSFVAGAAVGPVLLHAWDARALSLPVAGLLLLIALDLRTVRQPG